MQSKKCLTLELQGKLIYSVEICFISKFQLGSLKMLVVGLWSRVLSTELLCFQVVKGSPFLLSFMLHFCICIGIHVQYIKHDFLLHIFHARFSLIGK